MAIPLSSSSSYGCLQRSTLPVFDGLIRHPGCRPTARPCDRFRRRTATLRDRDRRSGILLFLSESSILTLARDSSSCVGAQRNFAIPWRTRVPPTYCPFTDYATHVKVTLYHCGPPANQSEIRAFNALKSGLISLPGDGSWVLLANLTFSVTHQLQSDEIDVVAIGPPGVRVIEVKHWGDPQRGLAEQAADLLTMKARRIGTTLRRIVPNLPRVDGAVVLTRPPSKAKRLLRPGKIRGVRFHSLKDWREAVGADGGTSLSRAQVAALARSLAPKSPVAMDGSLRRLASYVNLEPQTRWSDGFHRVYKGVHPVTRDRVLLHLYDLSAGEGADLLRRARREHDALHRLQRHRWAPRIMDSFQDAPGYPAEMTFFSVVDPAAPTMAQRSKDDSWSVLARLEFARATVRAVRALHEAGDHEQPFIHRNLSPGTILVLHDNSPVLTGFEHATMASDTPLSLTEAGDDKWSEMVAPEVRENGLGLADRQSDIYALCASLRMLFSDHEGDGQARKASNTTARGMGDAPDARVTLEELDRDLTKMLGESVPAPSAPPARFWSEGQVVPFRGREYRIVARLGSGGAGITFKVVELDPSTQEEVGTFVGKVAHDEANGDRTRICYQRARQPVSRHPGLSAVFEVTTEWRANQFTALLTWIEGAALWDFAGVLPLLAEQNRSDSEELVERWLRAMCDALATLHRNGLVHGDVSPRNMIVSGEELVLTDYDCVTRIGESHTSAGTVLYSAPSNLANGVATPADDIHALAASFFHVLFDREPFRREGDRLRKGSLNWDENDRGKYPGLVEFFDRAVESDPDKRLASAADALEALSKPSRSDSGEDAAVPPGGAGKAPREPPERTPNEVPWLRQLLGSYPGSRWGNRETRGLDSDFAEQTYVETALEETLFDDIVGRRVRLVILCGNAGDGKTALLQRLADALGMGRHDSSNREVDEVIEDGLRVRMNLDGSAACEGRSADEMLDEFLNPFRDGPPSQDIVHLLAVNDGRLLEWIDRPPRTPLKSNLEELLDATVQDPLERGAPPPHAYIAFHHLNERSHIGGVHRSEKRIETRFLDRLLDCLYDGARSAETWEPCVTCSAQESCQVSRASRVFGPGDLPGTASAALRKRARERLFAALQAVHFRGETHITIRELRSALVYILFGTRYCTDYHEGGGAGERPYWDRAFAADSPRRQGEVLRELVHLDPALEAHPKIDRELLRKGPRHFGEKALERLASQRRRAYFEWTEERVREVGGAVESEHGLGLTQGRHLRRFGQIPLLDEEERNRLCADLCRGIARIGDLPHLALDRLDHSNVVPLRITPRTPTETAFWSEKALSRFRLVSESDSSARADGNVDQPQGAVRLPRKAYLVYRYEDGGEERLRLSAGLFHRLLRLGTGFQLADVSSDDTFANLSVFLRRLAQEDDRELMAWHPMRDEKVYRVSAEAARRSNGPRQQLAIRESVPRGRS